MFHRMKMTPVWCLQKKKPEFKGKKDLETIVKNRDLMEDIDKCIEDISGAKCICPTRAVVDQVFRLLRVEERKQGELSGKSRLSFWSTRNKEEFVPLDFSWRNQLKKSKFLK